MFPGRGINVSDQTNSQTTTNAGEQPSDTSARKTTTARKTRTRKQAFSVTDLARARLRARGIKSDERLTSEAKVVRGILRANFALVRKQDAAVRKAKDEPNDRRPWPTNMNRHTYGVVVENKRK